uniref:K Homology domain-containing protein n=1 Tax=Panagrolaimus sp. ES5 TaxID=591445 RepID=A0AC34FNQ1_9BILA
MNGNEEMITETIEIPNNCVKFVIGQNGSQISAIHRESGCRLQISGFSLTTPNMNTCILMGTQNSIDKAKTLIQLILIRQNASLPESSSPNTTVSPQTIPIGHIQKILAIPGAKCGLIIGKNGDIIKTLQQQLNVKMWLYQENTVVTNLPKQLHIVGPLFNVIKACQIIEDILTTQIPPSLVVGLKTVGEVYIPRGCVSAVIGKNGQTIKRLRAESNCQIQFKCNEHPNSLEQCATLVGSPEEIARASQMISEVLFQAGQKRNHFNSAFHLPFNNQPQQTPPIFTSTVSKPTTLKDYAIQWAEYYGQTEMHFQNPLKKP